MAPRKGYVAYLEDGSASLNFIRDVHDPALPANLPKPPPVRGWVRINPAGTKLFDSAGVEIPLTAPQLAALATFKQRHDQLALQMDAILTVLDGDSKIRWGG